MTKTILKTPDLNLRLFTKEDAEFVAISCSDIKIYKTTLAIPRPYTTKHALDWISMHEENFLNDKYYEFAIEIAQTGELIGCIGLSNLSAHDSGELGYWIVPKHWGKGYATQAAKEVLRFAFDEKGYNRVFASFFAINPASGKVMEKIGMKYEGTRRMHIKKDGVYHDLVLFGIIK